MKKISIDEVKSSMQNYEYAYLQMISEHILDKVVAISSVDWDELLEGYIFNDDSQIHIYREDDELKAVILSDDIEDAHIIDRRYELAGKYKGIGNKVIIREYLKADEDGQSYIAASRLVGIE